VVAQTLDLYEAALARPRTAGSRARDTGALHLLAGGRARE
jgi:hypothetical protein